MERLTEHYGDRYIRIKGCTSAYLNKERKSAPASNAVVRLAAYEDTGLEPEEIMGLCELDRRAKMADLLRLEEYQALGPVEELSALVKARDEGRVVVLPCRDGDSVYNTASFFSQLKEPAEHIVDGFSVWHGEITILCKGGSKFGVNKIEKTVFLTRAEAEAAIGGGRND